MFFKTVPFEVKANEPVDGFRTFEGYASTWDKDLGGDTILPGAFTDTLKARLSKNLIKVRWMHSDPMGIVSDAYEDTKGLYITGKVPSTPTNDERFVLMQAGVVDKLSIGYDYSTNDVDYLEDGRIISKLDLYECSPVDLAMNEETSLTAVKSALVTLGLIELEGKIPGIEGIKAGRVLSKANRATILSARDALNAVLEADEKPDDDEKAVIADAWKNFDFEETMNNIRNWAIA